MTLLVQKFGGTSLANIERINHAADLVVKAKQAGHDVVVVVSAMAGETDRLIQLAHQMQAHPNEREYAALISTGEQVTMSLMAMALEKKGVSALSYTGWQAHLLTTSHHKKARIQAIDPTPILNAVKAGKVVVVAGFQGIDEQGDITTLGRGGSDTTAVALSVSLNAAECQIFTDVDGVYTTDPNVEPQAKRLDQVTFEEMLELSSLGSKVLQIRSVEFAGKYNVPLRVLSSMKPGPGTLIAYNRAQSMESPLVSGIAFSRNESKLTLSLNMNEGSQLTSIMMELSELGVNIDMLIQHVTPKHHIQLTFTLHQDEYAQTLAHFKQHADRLKILSIEGLEHISKLSVVGAGLKSHPTVAATLLRTLSEKCIQIQLMSMSEIKLSVVIDAARLDEGVRMLHEAFGLGGQRRDESAVKQDDLSPPYIEDDSVIYSEN